MYPFILVDVWTSCEFADAWRPYVVVAYDRNTRSGGLLPPIIDISLHVEVEKFFEVSDGVFLIKIVPLLCRV
jgi:hypothetical protein